MDAQCLRVLARWWCMSKIGLPACALVHSIRTGPSPVLHPVHKTGLHRIAFYVTDHLRQFIPVANPVVVRFILPEGLPGAIQNFIRTFRREVFDRFGNFCHWGRRVHDDVDMVRHNHPSHEFIKLQFRLSESERVNHNLRDPIIAQPGRPEPSGIQLGLVGSECRIVPACSRQRPEKPPGDEKRRTFRLPVGKVSGVIAHELKWPHDRKFSQEKAQARRPIPRGSVALETAMYLPILFLLLFGTVELAKITYTYYSLQKIMSAVARYAGTQQGANFCDAGDPVLTAAKQFAVSASLDTSASPVVENLTPDMIQLRAERIDANTGELD